MAEFVTCPTCGSKVLTADSLLGRHVRCVGCGDRFLASPDSPVAEAVAAPAALAPPRAAPRYDADDEDDDDGEWPFCPGCGRRVSWREPDCPHCGEEFEDEEPRPAPPLFVDVALPTRRDGEPHRGGLLLTLAVLSAIAGALSGCVFGFSALVSIPLGAAVWALASRDLRRMADGSVDPRGIAQTRHARSAAIAGVLFGVLFGGIYLLIWSVG
jgi:hypothetical protein